MGRVQATQSGMMGKQESVRNCMAWRVHEGEERHDVAVIGGSRVVLRRSDVMIPVRHRCRLQLSSERKWEIPRPHGLLFCHQETGVNPQNDDEFSD